MKFDSHTHIHIYYSPYFLDMGLNRVFIIFCLILFGISGGALLASDTITNCLDIEPDYFLFVSSAQLSWENPYGEWDNPDMILMGGQGPHLHTASYALNPDAVIDLETIFQLFSQHEWPASWWAERGVNVGGYHNTNGGYEFLIIGAHNQRRTNQQYNQLLTEATRLGKEYGIIVVYGSEVSPPHEGIIWNGLNTNQYYPNNFTTGGAVTQKSQFSTIVRNVETADHHSISVILHPQTGGRDGRNTLESTIDMLKNGSGLLEIFNGGWESGDDLRVNDHLRLGSTNSDTSPADGNAEDLWDNVLSIGYKVWGTGCDDFHGYRKGLMEPRNSHKWAGNYCWMEVLTPQDSTPEDIVRSIEKGAFYVTQGVQIESITVTGDTITVVGDETVDFIEVIGSKGGETALRPLNQGNGDTGTLLLTQKGNSVTYTADKTTRYDNIYVRFRLVNTDYNESFYYDEHLDGGGDVYAWTQPFFSRNVIRVMK